MLKQSIDADNANIILLGTGICPLGGIHDQINKILSQNLQTSSIKQITYVLVRSHSFNGGCKSIVTAL